MVGVLKKEHQFSAHDLKIQIDLCDRYDELYFTS